MMNEELMQRSDIWAGWKIVREIGRGASGAVYEIQKEEAGHTYRAALKEIYLEEIRKLHNKRSAGSGKKRCFFLNCGGIPMLYPMSITQLLPMGSPVYIF